MISFLNRGSGGAGKPNIFIHEDEPTIKDGIWFKKAKSNYNKLIVTDSITGGVSSNTEILEATIGYSNLQALGKYLYILDTSDTAYTGIRFDTETQVANSTFTTAPTYLANTRAACSAVCPERNEIYYFYRYGNGNWFSIFNVNKGIWDNYSISSLNTVFSGNITAVKGDTIYIISGTGINDTTRFEAFKAGTYAVTHLTNLPYARYNGAAVVYDNKIYMFGGGETAYRTKRLVYDIEAGTFTTYNDIPFAFYKGSAVVMGSLIYLIQGTDLYTFDPATNAYDNIATLSTSILKQEGRNNMVVVDNTIYVTTTEAPHNIISIGFGGDVSFDPNSVVIQNGNTYSTALLTQPANTEGKLVTPFKNIYTTDNAGEIITTEEKYYGNGTDWVLIN